MATKILLICTDCKQETDRMELYKLLNDISKAKGTFQGKKTLPCPKCENGACTVELEFAFALGVKEKKHTIIDCFTSKERLKNRPGSFQPFLVFMERKGKDKAVWFPYYHTITTKSGKTKKLFGQWAPCMDTKLFGELLSQFKEKYPQDFKKYVF